MNKYIALAAAAASVALTGAAFAHPHQGGDGKQTVENIIVMTKHDGKDGKPVREFRTMRGPNGEFTCPNGNATKIDETTGGDRTKVLICGDDKLSNAERAKKLEDALARMRSREGVSGEHRAKVEAALEDAIARLRAGN
ncbi:MAG TPA: hypothetical protein VGB48_01065 [Allosphingosinicella sp.]